MNEQSISDLQAVLGAIRQKLADIDAKQDNSKPATSSVRRRQFSKGLPFGWLLLAAGIVLASGLVFADDEALYIDRTGKVGIGTTSPEVMLEVDGGVKIGNDDSTCDAKKAGTIRWSGAGFEGCDGSAWRIMLSRIPTVTSSTGQIWMDRNLGASRVATSSTDTAAYGDLYQWGRLADGHQARNSDTTSEISKTDDPGHGEFIIVGSSPYDWKVPQNNSLWQGASGPNNPCPAGFRLPTYGELEAERVSWKTNDSEGAFASPLKLVVAGYRYHSGGTLSGAGGDGYYWSSTVDGSYARSLFFSSGSAGMGSSYRAVGFSVRCLKD